MYNKRVPGFVFIAVLLVLTLTIYSCGIDEHNKRAKLKEKKQTMDSLFKDADKIPVIELEYSDTLEEKE